MKTLRRALLPALLPLALLACSQSAQAASIYTIPEPGAELRKEAEKKLCRPTDEYAKTLKFLRETKDFSFREDASRMIADQVSKGCDGAAARFAQVITLLKTIGLSEKRSLMMALEFASTSPDVQKNFVEIFSKSFLAEFFDYEYTKALKLAVELSTDYKGDPAAAREDFIALVKFCKDSQKLDLPVNFCAEYAVRLAKLSQYHYPGVRQPFFSLYDDLRNKKELSLDMKTALQMSYDILQHGPTAPKSFMDAFALATKELEYDKKKALAFALELASRSHVGETPPVMQAPAPAVGAAEIPLTP